MKNAKIILLFFLIISPFISGQNLKLSWAIKGPAFYAGDLDNDGVGEIMKLIYTSSALSSLEFYDGKTHNLKWNITVNSDEELFYHFSTFKDFNGNGVKDIILLERGGSYSGYYGLLRIVDPSTNSTLFTCSNPADNNSGAYDNGIIIANIDGGSTAELVIRKVSQPFSNPSFDSLCVYSSSLPVTAINNSEKEIPVNFKLEQNYPNPFNPATTIEYTLPNDGNGKIEIFDSVGRLIKSIDTENKKAGTYKMTFDSRDSNGRFLASGVYYYRLVFGDKAEVKKMLLLK
jgi:hypothetical protein